MIDDLALCLQFKNAAKSVFDEYRRQLAETSIIGYSISFDETPSSFYLTVATESSRERLCLNQVASSDDYLFCPSEWSPAVNRDCISRLAREHTYPIMKQFNAIYEESEDYDFDENWHEIFQARIFSMGALVLASLSIDGYFGTEAEREGIFIIPWVSDSKIPWKFGRAWSKRINGETMNSRFNLWLDSKAG